MNAAERKQAKQGALLVYDLYQMIQQWRDKGRPEEGDFEWNQDGNGSDLCPVSKLIWGSSRALRRRPGPRTRYEWVTEHAPIAVLAKAKSGTVYAVFRGTNISKEWDMNAQFGKIRPWAIEGSYAAVHRGFQAMYVSMRGRLQEDLTAILNPDNSQRLFFCGHSLGGALAVLAVRDLFGAGKLKTNSKAGIITYGSPRIGDGIFAAEVESMVSNYHRFEVPGDPVTRLPLERHGYRHAGQAISLEVETERGHSRHSMLTYLKGLS